MTIAYAWRVPPDYFYDKSPEFIATALAVLNDIADARQKAMQNG